MGTKISTLNIILATVIYKLLPIEQNLGGGWGKNSKGGGGGGDSSTFPNVLTHIHEGMHTKETTASKPHQE